MGKTISWLVIHIPKEQLYVADLPQGCVQASRICLLEQHPLYARSEHVARDTLEAADVFAAPHLSRHLDLLFDQKLP